MAASPSTGVAEATRRQSGQVGGRSHADRPALPLQDRASQAVVPAACPLVRGHDHGLDAGRHAVGDLDVDHVRPGAPDGLLEMDLAAVNSDPSRIPDRVHGSPLWVLPHEIQFERSQFGEDVVAVGAASLVLDHAFSPRPEGLLITR